MMKSNLDENNELQMELEKKEAELKEEKAELKKKKVELKTTIAELAGDENREVQDCVLWVDQCVCVYVN